MFYSITLLGRKAPFGAVWLAAHEQHKLKKKHYTETRIPETVEKIMCPDVPIALRLSAFLLFGITRIYSRKVDYLLQDCNSVYNSFIKAFASIEINLPEDARQAPVDSITLPERFDLDAFELEYDAYAERGLDDHLRNPEEITLSDHIPVEIEPYEAVTFDEDIPADSQQREDVPDMGVRPMDEDVSYQNPLEGNMGFQDQIHDNQTEVITTPPGLNNQAEAPNRRVADNRSPQGVPEIEVMRDATNDFILEQPNPLLPDQGIGEADEHNRSFNRNTSEKAIPSPTLDDILASGGQALPFQLQPEPPSSIVSEADPGAADTSGLFRNMSPGLAIRSTPPPVQHVRQRKRKALHFDRTISLSNEFMKNALENCDDLKRKRKNAPCNALGVWRQHIRLRKEQIFEDPITGLSENLYNDLIVKKPHLLESAEPSVSRTYPTTETFQEPQPPQSPAGEWHPEPSVAPSAAPATETFLDPGTAQSPGPLTEVSREPQTASSPVSIPLSEMEIERLRSYQDPSPSNILPSFRSFASGRDYSASASTNLRSESEFNFTATGTGMTSASDVGTSAGTYRSVLDTPMTYPEERSGAGTFDLPLIPELTSTDNGDLHFLEADNNSPAGSERGDEFDMLSVRTRAVAQHLKRQSLEESSGNLSLFKMVEGKTRKVCARMFYETLVLKSHDFLDVQQEEPYGDITLKLTPEVSKMQL